MMKKTRLFRSFLLVCSTIACVLLAAGAANGANSPATDPAARMKSWEQHVKLKQESIFKDLKWVAVGPRIQGGKIESIWSPKGHSSTIYVGVGSGNLWKTVNNGTTWKPIFEQESTFSVSVVTVSDNDPNLVWVGTGEPHMARSSFAGTGVFKSTNAGETWQHMGLVDTHHIGRVLIDPKDSDVVYVAALGHQYTYNEERGVFKTTDGGKTWKKILYISEKVGVVEVAMDPSDNKTLYAIAWERDRKAWDNVEAGPGSGLYKSTDAGKNWKRIAGGLPTGEKVGRMGITIAPSNPNVLYIICDHRGVGGEVYRSDDKGENWRKTHEGRVKTGIGYDFCLIRVLPDNEDEIFIVGFNLLYSPDAGKTQISLSERVVPMLSYKTVRETPHCDNHDMFIDRADPNKVMLGTDGGLYISYDRAKTWLHVNTLPIAEFYAISVDNNKPYRIWGGTQDNGVLDGEAKPITIGLEHWNWDGGGDNYVTRIDPNNLDTMYTEGMFGGMERRDLKTGKRKGIRPRAPQDEPRLRSNWMTPFILSHYNSETLYAGAQMVFKSTNRGDDWTCISPDLSTNPGPEKQGDVPFGTITDISESELMQGLLYAGTDDGQVHVTKDDGATWTKINQGLPDKWVTRLVASKYEVGTVFLSFTGYREDDFEKYLYMSTDFGKTWKSIAGNMAAESINVIREDPSDKDILYVGTELGAYCSLDRGKSWHSLSNHLPTTPVHDIAVHPTEGDLVIGTHGRSAFVLDTEKIKQRKQQGR
ncbi:WD40/YVTN/BNR-like repeat-containing protein [Candidatus Sumerlaeota bacterium]